MKTIEFEEWSIDTDTCKIYTNSKRLFNQIIKEAKTECANTYMLKGVPFGWDANIDKKYMSKVRRLYKNAIKKSKVSKTKK